MRKICGWFYSVYQVLYCLICCWCNGKPFRIRVCHIYPRNSLKTRGSYRTWLGDQGSGMSAALHLFSGHSLQWARPTVMSPFEIIVFASGIGIAICQFAKHGLVYFFLGNNNSFCCVLYLLRMEPSMGASSKDFGTPRSISFCTEMTWLWRIDFGWDVVSATVSWSSYPCPGLCYKWHPNNAFNFLKLFFYALLKW